MQRVEEWLTARLTYPRAAGKPWGGLIPVNDSRSTYETAVKRVRYIAGAPSGGCRMGIPSTTCAMKCGKGCFSRTAQSGFEGLEEEIIRRIEQQFRAIVSLKQLSFRADRYKSSY
jgi:hypothetical protein